MQNLQQKCGFVVLDSMRSAHRQRTLRGREGACRVCVFTRRTLPCSRLVECFANEVCSLVTVLLPPPLDSGWRVGLHFCG